MKKTLPIAISFSLFFIVTVHAQYTVTSIPYNPPDSFNVGTAVTVHADDEWSHVIALPFTFCFFGNNYNYLINGANQITSFDTTGNTPGGFCPWQLTGGDTLPSSSFPLNSIMWPYEDVDNTCAGDFSFELIGTVPNRMLIVSCDSVPYYGGTGSLNTGYCTTPPIYATSMMVLYESTNIIDIYIQNKDTCHGWNGGLAIEGIQDATGANAFVVPGRNNTRWDTANDAWRFTPIITGIGNYSYNNIILYPDPTDNIITLELNKNITKVNTYISIFDIWGNQLLQMPVNNQKTDIDVSSFPCGVYLVEVRTEKGVEVKKFVKE
jgi:hypothetical protein